ncbi:MAG TPA: hypothetical protein VH851_15735 [Candidatus Binatia bacterium]
MARTIPTARRRKATPDKIRAKTITPDTLRDPYLSNWRFPENIA